MEKVIKIDEKDIKYISVDEGTHKKIIVLNEKINPFYVLKDYTDEYIEELIFQKLFIQPHWF